MSNYTREQIIEIFKKNSLELVEQITDPKTDFEGMSICKGQLGGCNEILIMHMTDEENKEWFENNPKTKLIHPAARFHYGQLEKGNNNE